VVEQPDPDRRLVCSSVAGKDMHFPLDLRRNAEDAGRFEGAGVNGPFGALRGPCDKGRINSAA
jgi:hypothetical protein